MYRDIFVSGDIPDTWVAAVTSALLLLVEWELSSANAFSGRNGEMLLKRDVW
jgi:hypothetical protein